MLDQDISIALTAAAQRHVSAFDLAGPINSAGITASAAVGDLITFQTDGRAHDFALRRRRWVIADGKTKLEITLDYPARRGA